MTDGDLEYRLQARIEPERHRLGTYGPGAYVWWVLAQHIDSPDKILFADLTPDSKKSDYSVRTGSIFLVLPESILLVSYDDALAESDGDPNVQYGTVTIDVHPWSKETRPSITWTNRDLRIYSQRGSRDSSVSKLALGAIECRGSTWARTLPGVEPADGDEYFRNLLDAFGLRP